MYPSSCAGSVVSFKTHKLVLFRLDISLVLRASVVNLAHVYPLRFKTRMPINVRLDFGLVLRAAVVNLAHMYLPLSFKTRMPILFRLDLGLVLRASAVNLAQNPLPASCRPGLLGGSLTLRLYPLIQGALATMHHMRHRHFPQEWEADFLPPADHILRSP